MTYRVRWTVCLVVAWTWSLALTAWAAPIDSATALQAARGWLIANPRPMLKDAGPEKWTAVNVRPFADSEGRTLAFVVDLKPGGFIILPSDDALDPVLAFATKGSFRVGRTQCLGLPELLRLDLPQRLATARQASVTEQENVANRWIRLASVSVTAHSPLFDAYPVALWETASWDQVDEYAISTPIPGYPSGCVATAMGIIIRYHEYPASATVGGQYTVDGYPQNPPPIQANYDYTLMPLQLSWQSPFVEQKAISDLLFHCGRAVGQDYALSGSGIPTAEAEQRLTRAYRNTFGYGDVSWISGQNSTWYTTLKSELNARRPVQLVITGGDVGHSIVCDGWGYDQTYERNECIHLNFGWNGAYNTWYYPGDGTMDWPAGGYRFTCLEGLVYNIRPPAPPACWNALRFEGDVTVPDGSCINANEAFTKAWRLRNTGSCSWGGGYKFAFDGGDQMGAPSYISVPSVAPGATWDPSVGLRAPSTPGHYRGYWRMQNPQGVKFGTSVYVDINVQNPCAPPDVYWTSTPPGGRWYRSCERLSYHVNGTRPNTVVERASGSGWQGGPYNTSDGYIDICWAGLGWHDYWVDASNACGSDATDHWGGGWDDVPPAAYRTGGAAPNVWYRLSPSVSWTASDAHSGVKHILYHWNSEGWSGGASAQLRDGRNTLWVRAEDNAWTGGSQSGNWADYNLGEYLLDNTPPVVSPPNPDVPENTNAVVINFALNAWDSQSGVREVRVLVNDKQIGSIGSGAGVFRWDTTGLPDGEYFIKAVAIDRAIPDGNSATSSSVRLFLDKTAPAISYVIGPMCGDWYRQRPLVDVVCGDGGAGSPPCSLEMDGQSVTGPLYVPEGVHHLVMRATDNAGHVEESRSVIRVDLTRPMLWNIAAAASADTVAASWQQADGGSGVGDAVWWLGTTPGGADLAAPTHTGGARHCWRAGVNLAPGVPYYLSVKVIDNACNESAVQTAQLPPLAPGSQKPFVMASGGVTGEGRTSDGYVVFDTLGEPIAGYTGGAGFSEVAAGYWTVDPDAARILNLAEAWTIPDYRTVVLATPMVVTAGTDDFLGRFYVEQPDRAAGIRVDVSPGTGVTAERNSSVLISGKLSTVSGERVIEHPAVELVGTAQPVRPLVMPNATLGGEAMSAAQPGVYGGTGLLNVGLLVTTSGWLYPYNDDAFFILDQQGQFGTMDGVWVMLDGLAEGNVIPTPVAGYVSVTGISSVVEMDGAYFRCIRPRSAADVQVVF